MFSCVLHYELVSSSFLELLSLGDLRRADVHGHDGMLPAFFEIALGGVPE